MLQLSHCCSSDTCRTDRGAKSSLRILMDLWIAWPSIMICKEQLPGTLPSSTCSLWSTSSGIWPNRGWLQQVFVQTDGNVTLPGVVKWCLLSDWALFGFSGIEKLTLPAALCWRSNRPSPSNRNTLRAMMDGVTENGVYKPEANHASNNSIIMTAIMSCRSSCPWRWATLGVHGDTDLQHTDPGIRT